MERYKDVGPYRGTPSSEDEEENERGSAALNTHRSQHDEIKDTSSESETSSVESRSRTKKVASRKRKRLAGDSDDEEDSDSESTGEERATPLDRHTQSKLRRFDAIREVLDADSDEEPLMLSDTSASDDDSKRDEDKYTRWYKGMKKREYKEARDKYKKTLMVTERIEKKMKRHGEDLVAAKAEEADAAEYHRKKKEERRGNGLSRLFFWC